MRQDAENNKVIDNEAIIGKELDKKEERML